MTAHGATVPIVAVSGVGKRYRHYRSNLQRFAGWFGAEPRVTSDFWALKDVSFTLERGACVGFIGANGAGKSTLLKLITGTTRPTTGTIAITGRVSAILELGIGFNPDLTGRENVRHAGGLLGHASRDLDALIPGIQAFAELGAFFDAPLRTYSSGMQARLAFSLATATRPDVLIVDEVLSVGDSYFQHKSFARIRKFRDQGTSILIVSHAMGDLRALCDRIVLIERGRVLREGPPDEVIDLYNALLAERQTGQDASAAGVTQERTTDGWLRTRSGDGKAVARAVRLVDAAHGHVVETVAVGQRVAIEMRVAVHEALPRLVLGLMLRERTGHVVWGTNTWHTKQVLEHLVAGETVTFRLPFACVLGPGSYALTYALAESSSHLSGNFEWVDNSFVFDVVNTAYPVFIGTTHIDSRFEITRGTDAVS